MPTIIRGIRSVFRSKGKNIAVITVLAICFMLGILMMSIDEFASKKVESIKKELGTYINLEIKEEYLNEFAENKKDAEQYSEDPFSFEEIISKEISKNQHVVSNQSIISGAFYSEKLIPSMEIMMGEIKISLDYFNPDIESENDEEEYDHLEMFLLTGISNAKDLNEFIDKKYVLSNGDFFYEYDIQKDVCMVDSDFADANHLDLGSIIVVNGESLKIKAIYRKIMLEGPLGEVTVMTGAVNNIYVPLQTAQKLLRKEGTINKSTFRVDSYDNVKKVLTISKGILERKGYGDKLVIYGDASKFNKSVSYLESVKKISKAGILSSFSAALIIIVSSMFVNVRGRAKEIGILKAIGSSNLSVIKQFLAESLTICLIALFLGLALTSFADNYLINNFILKKSRENELRKQEEMQYEEMFDNKLDSQIMNVESEVKFSGKSFVNFETDDGIKSNDNAIEVLDRWDLEMDLKIILYASIFSVMTSLIGTAIPAVFIARIQPAQVFRFE